MRPCTGAFLHGALIEGLPPRARAFIDFIAEPARVTDPTLKRAGDGKWRSYGEAR